MVVGMAVSFAVIATPAVAAWFIGFMPGIYSWSSAGKPVLYSLTMDGTVLGATAADVDAHGQSTE
jgi:hypothetical protein